MALYTMTIHEVYASYNNDYAAIAADLFKGINYPIFDESYRSVLQTEFVKHFYNMEICYNMWDWWLLELDNRFNDLAPKYNTLWTEEKRILEIGTIEMFGSGRTETYTSKDDNTNHETGTTNITNSTETIPNTNETITNDVRTGTTPFTPYTPDEYVNEISKNTQSTAMTGKTNVETAGDSTVDNTKIYSGTTEYERKVSGNAVDDHNFEILMSFAAGFTSIDKMFFDELHDLFFGLW